MKKECVQTTLSQLQWDNRTVYLCCHHVVMLRTDFCISWSSDLWMFYRKSLIPEQTEVKMEGCVVLRQKVTTVTDLKNTELLWGYWGQWTAPSAGGASNSGPGFCLQTCQHPTPGSLTSWQRNSKLVSTSTHCELLTFSATGHREYWLIIFSQTLYLHWLLTRRCPFSSSVHPLHRGLQIHSQTVVWWDLQRTQCFFLFFQVPHSTTAQLCRSLWAGVKAAALVWNYNTNALY